MTLQRVMPAALPLPWSSRRPRFRRVDSPPPFQLTARNLAILHAVARFRFLSSTLIIRLAGGSAQQVLRRLQLRFHHGYLDRPTAQVAQFAHVFDFSNRPFIYGLGRAGALVLAEAGIPLKEKLDWTAKNARVTAQFFAHPGLPPLSWRGSVLGSLFTYQKIMKFFGGRSHCLENRKSCHFCVPVLKASPFPKKLLLQPIASLWLRSDAYPLCKDLKTGASWRTRLCQPVTWFFLTAFG
jgi:hypothetical protein